MKKIMNKVNFAIISMMAAAPAFAANGDDGLHVDAICDLVTRMGSLFKMLRTFAFIGAAFMIAGWAWGFIVEGKADTGKIKERGIALLVGAILLFTVGIILTMLFNFAGNGWICSTPLSETFN